MFIVVHSGNYTLNKLNDSFSIGLQLLAKKAYSVYTTRADQAKVDVAHLPKNRFGDTTPQSVKMSNTPPFPSFFTCKKNNETEVSHFFSLIHTTRIINGRIQQKTH